MAVACCQRFAITTKRDNPRRDINRELSYIQRDVFTKATGTIHAAVPAFLLQFVHLQHAGGCG
jgi:hypothetical protein